MTQRVDNRTISFTTWVPVCDADEDARNADTWRVLADRMTYSGVRAAIASRLQ